MLSLFLAWSLVLLSACARECVQHQDVVVERVIDGDTVAIRVPGLPRPLDARSLSLRILGVDCPETGRRAQCDDERQRGVAATEFTRSLLETAKKKGMVETVELCDWDKYGGRVLGDVLLGNERVAHLLVHAGHAVAYDGRGARHVWCEEDEL